MRSLLTIAILGFSAPAWAVPSIRLAHKSTVRSATIRLGDIAQIDGLGPNAARQAAGIALGRSPSVGVAKYVPRSFIESRVRRRLGQAIRVQGPERLQVTRRSGMIRGDVLRQKVRLAIQSKMSHALDKVAEIRIPRVPDVRVPEGATARVRFEEREDFSGSVDATILIEDGALKVSTRRVNANIDLYTVVLTVRDELHRGHQISPKDLIPLQIAESKVPRDAVYRAAFVAGAEVRRRIRPGQPIRQAWFKIPPVVKRGQRVRLVALRGAIRISTMGEALNNAVKGGFVRVRNVDSRKIVTGRATQSGTVEMEF